MESQHWVAPLAVRPPPAVPAALPPLLATKPLQLHRMPHDFASLTAQLHERPCASCGRSPVDPALCLVCGALLCARQRREWWLWWQCDAEAPQKPSGEQQWPFGSSKGHLDTVPSGAGKPGPHRPSERTSKRN